MELAKTIENVALRLPKMGKRQRKNMFDILGIKKKETINSRILGYFFNSNEDHQLGTLFFDSLIELCANKCNLNVETYSGEYSVLTEESTSQAARKADRQKFIDLTLSGENWSLIIENKLYHHLSNPLDIYLDHKSRDYEHVTGIILSIKQYSKENCRTKKGKHFINITHAELINQVQLNLRLGNGISTTSLQYLNEYIKTIQSHYKDEKDETAMNNIVEALINQGSHIKEIQKKLEKAEGFIEEQIEEVFLERGFEKRKNWYLNPKFPGLYFWVHSTRDIILDNYLRIHYETRNEINQKVTNEGIINHFEKTGLKHMDISYGNLHNSKWFTHIARYNNKEFLKPGENFKEQLAKVMDDIYLKPGGIQDEIVTYLNRTINYQELIPKEVEADE